MIIPVYKPLGASSHQLAAKIGQARNEKATHTGTLDPMAEGVLVVVTGEDRFRKSELANTKKTYEFSMLLGVSTDSHDLLGLSTAVATQLDPLEILVQKVTSLLPSFLGQQTQEQPLFSAGRVGGESLFEVGSRGKNVEDLPKNNITIDSFTMLNSQVLVLSELQKEIPKKIATVSGDFRQPKILANWNTTFQALNSNKITELPLMTFRVAVSKRTYIRGIVRDLAKKVGVNATTYSITRTQNGHYTLEDCQETNTNKV